jgi:uncharacterized protein (TIGR04255 family)
MEFKNHKITEAICAFRFQVIQNNWNIGVFADFFKHIQPLGFTQQLERKPASVSFRIEANKIQAPEMEQGEIQLIFHNPEKQLSIILSKGLISFHAQAHYNGWDTFFPNFIEPIYVTFLSMDILDSLDNVQMLFINRFALENGTALSAYLNFVPDTKNIGGTENGHFFISNFSKPPNIALALQVHMTMEESVKNVDFHCNAVVYNNQIDSQWFNLAATAHSNAVDIFKNSITPYFISIIQ